MGVGLGTLQRLEVEVGADTSAADRELHQFTRAAGSGGGGHFGGLAVAGAAAFAAIGAGAAAAGGWGLSVAMDAENAAVGFTTMLGSGEAAQAMLGDLQDFAATTPFEFPQLRDAASRLIAVGTATEDVIPLMSALGDATSGMGTGAEGIDRAVTALTQMQQKGRVMAQEMLQLTEAGIPAWETLAATLGTDVAGAQEQVTAGTVTAATMYEALENRAGPAMQRLTGLMAEQSQTLGGMLSTLKDTAGLALADAMAPVVESLKGQLPAFTTLLGDTLTQLGPSIATLATGLVDLASGLLPVLQPIVGTIADIAGAFLSALGPALQAMAPLVQVMASNLGGAIVTALNALAPILPIVGDALGMVAVNLGGALATALETAAPLLGDLLVALAPLLPVISQLIQDALLALIPAISDVAWILIPLVAAFVGTSDEAGPLMVVLEALSAVLVAIPTDVLTALVYGFIAFQAVGAVTGIIQGITVAMGALNATFLANPIVLAVAAVAAAAFLIVKNWDTISAFFSDLWGNVTDAFAAAWEWISGFLGDLPGRIGGFLADAGSWLLNAGTDLLTGLVNGIARGVTALAAWWLNLPFVIHHFLEDAAGWLLDIGPKILGGLLTGIELYVGFLWDFWTGLPGRIIDLLGDVGGFLTGTGWNLVVGLYNGIVGFWGETAWPWIAGLPGRILGDLGDLGSLLFNAGGDIVNGLWDGLVAVGSQLADWVGGWIESILPGPVTRFLGISSPSTMARWWGLMVGEGMALGLGDQVGLVAGMSDRLAAAATPTIPGATIGGFTAAGGLAASLAPLPASLTGQTGSPAPVVLDVTLELDGNTVARVLVDPLRGELIETGAANAGRVLGGLG